MSETEDPYKYRDHLGDGVYVHYTGYSYEISVNDHRNKPVVILDDNIINALLNFRRRMNQK